MKRAVLIFLLTAAAALPALSDTQTVQITCRKTSYQPETVRLRKGVPARIVLQSADVTHGFAIDEFKIAVEVSPGPPVTVEFTPDRSGKFEFYCVVRCGKEHLKMRGVLIIE